MSFFNINDGNGNSVAFEQDEATDTGTTLPFYSMEMGDEKSSSGKLKQQIRPGKRFNKSFLLAITEAKYIDFTGLLTNNALDYYISYTIKPTLLDNDSDVPIASENDFAISVSIKSVSITAGKPVIYRVPITIVTANLL